MKEDRFKTQSSDWRHNKHIKSAHALVKPIADAGPSTGSGRMWPRPRNHNRPCHLLKKHPQPRPKPKKSVFAIKHGFSKTIRKRLVFIGKSRVLRGLNTGSEHDKKHGVRKKNILFFSRVWLLLACKKLQRRFS